LKSVKAAKGEGAGGRAVTNSGPTAQDWLN